MEVNKILCGHILPTLKAMPGNYVDTIITSPPYWGLRDYGKSTKVIWNGDKNCKHQWGKEQRPANYNWMNYQNVLGNLDKGHSRQKDKAKSNFCQKCGAWYGQLGLEPTLDMYIKHLLMVTAELKRILKPTGVLFWNHGDCYGGSWQNYGSRDGGQRTKETESFERKGNPTKDYPPTARLTPKCLALQNYRLILRMIDEQGWILRNDIKWHKKNPMPSSVKDRFTNTYEPVFMLVKQGNPQYYYNIRTGLMADRKPKELKEGVDWDWKEVPDFAQEVEIEGQGSKTKQNVSPERKSGGHFSYGGINSPFSTTKGKSDKLPKKYKKISYWHSLNYWFDLDAVRKPIRQTTIERYGRNFGSPTNKYRGQDPAVIGGAKIDLRPKELKNLRRQDARAVLSKKQGMHTFYSHSRRNKTQIENYKFGMRNAPEPGEPNAFHAVGKNPGDLWTISTQPFPEAHFATFPEKLIEPMIKAACPGQICKKCGKARVRITKKELQYTPVKTQTEKGIKREKGTGQYRPNSQETGGMPSSNRQTIGWTDCGCKAGWRSGIVLDPFGGAMTTCVVAKKLRRDYIAVELNPEYAKIGQKRLSNTIRPML